MTVAVSPVLNSLTRYEATHFDSVFDVSVTDASWGSRVWLDEIHSDPSLGEHQSTKTYAISS